MAGLNKVSLIGNLGGNPETRNLDDGGQLAMFNMATTEDWTDRATGERKSATEWHRVVVFGGLTTIVIKYLKKGSKVYVEGKLKTKKWTDKDGVERYTTEVVLSGFGSNLVLLDGKNTTDVALEDQKTF
jgi:single-strand DNA-binding protein